MKLSILCILFEIITSFEVEIDGKRVAYETMSTERKEIALQRYPYPKYELIGESSIFWVNGLRQSVPNNKKYYFFIKTKIQ